MGKINWILFDGLACTVLEHLSDEVFSCLGQWRWNLEPNFVQHQTVFTGGVCLQALWTTIVHVQLSRAVHVVCGGITVGSCSYKLTGKCDALASSPHRCLSQEPNPIDIKNPLCGH